MALVDRVQIRRQGGARSGRSAKKEAVLEDVHARGSNFFDAAAPMDTPRKSGPQKHRTTEVKVFALAKYWGVRITLLYIFVFSFVYV